MVSYFAYGSNISENKMNKIGVNFYSREKSLLKNYRLVFNKQSKQNPSLAFANIEQNINTQVEGVLYTINEEDVLKLDRCEGFPRHYIKKEISVEKNNGEIVNAFTYVANQEKVKSNLKPSQEYLNLILEGKNFMSKEYYNNLRNIL